MTYTINDALILRDILLLADVDVPLETIRKWEKKEYEAADAWAWKTHLRASDNSVKVPPRPGFLPGGEGQ